MAPRRKVILWLLAIVIELALLALAVILLQAFVPRRVSTTFLTGDPLQGVALFERKGCIRCHSINGWGAKLAPDLAAAPVGRGDLNHLVSAMWNHAPAMWKSMEQEKVTVAPISEHEMASLFAYLYIARYIDEPGNVDRGERLFRSKDCMRCHTVDGSGGKLGPDLSKFSGLDTPIAWTQAMWNHAPAMEMGMHRAALPWPTFADSEMNDLLAYIREKSGGLRSEYQLLPANPYNGWKIFQDKGCSECHNVTGDGNTTGPNLARGHDLPTTMVQFAGVMWNHSPAMLRAMTKNNVKYPTFKGLEMADLIAFLAGLRYFEPHGSATVGASLFVKRGCANCHGAKAEGTRNGPALRNQRGFGSIALATALWRHGPTMYQRTKSIGLSWPTLEERDLGDLIAYLDTPADERH